MSEKSSQVVINVYVNGDERSDDERRGFGFTDDIEEFRAVAKFDPIPVAPGGPGRLLTVNAASLLTATFFFETDDDLDNTMVGGIPLRRLVKVKLRKVTDLDPSSSPHEERENRAFRPDKEINLSMDARCRLSFRYQLDISFDPEEHRALGPWAVDDPVRVTVKYNRGTDQAPHWLGGVAHGKLN